MKKTLTALLALAIGMTAGASVSFGAGTRDYAESVISQIFEALGVKDEEPDPVPPVSAEAGDYQYSVNTDKTTVTITGYTGDADVIEIPSEIDGYVVSEIGYQAFTYKEMKSLVLPDSIGSIGQRAFEYCTIIDTLRLPEHVAIQTSTFGYAQLPPVVVIPAGATVEGRAFEYCEDVSEVFIGPEVTLEGRAFGYCDDLDQLVCGAGSLLQSQCFEYCDDLENVTYCGNVETEEDAFSHCGTIEVTRAAEEEFDLLLQAAAGTGQLSAGLNPDGTAAIDSDPNETQTSGTEPSGATAEPMSWLDYTDNVLEDGSPIYYFPELSLKLPADWLGKVLVLREDRGTAFYHKDSYRRYKEEGIEGGGFLFCLGTSVNGSFSQLPAFEYLGFSEESVLNYYLELPSDYPAYMNDEAVRAEYDAMYAQIGEVVSSVSFYAEENGVDQSSDTEPAPDQGEAEAGPPADTGTPSGNDGQDTEITLEQVRYHFEHNAIPRYFYEDPANVLAVLREQGIYMLWTALADENGAAYPYRADDFEEYWYELDDGTSILQAVMPKPEVTPQCYRIYLLYNPNTGEAGYYTAEYDNFFGDDAFLCGWDSEHNHMNYGGAAVTEKGSSDYQDILKEELGQVAELAGLSAGQIPDEPAFAR